METRPTSHRPVTILHPSILSLSLTHPEVKMKDEEAQSKAATVEVGGGCGRLFGRTRYKFWALAAILLLAMWSMLTGSVTLKWSAGNLALLSGDLDSPFHDDLDILEVEEREKVVRQMWDVYSHSNTIRLPRFWQQAFEAAYEYLTSDVPGVRNAAFSEIAKMSLFSIDVESPPVQATVREPVKEGRRPSRPGKSRRRRQL